LKQGCDFLIGTPGRILELLKSNTPQKTVLDLSQIRHLVLDECDKMLNMGFLSDLKSIFEFLPKPHEGKSKKKQKETEEAAPVQKHSLPAKPMQVLMFSATLTRGIEDLMYRFAPSHELVNLNASMQVANAVKHVQYHVGHHHLKYGLLLYLLKRKGTMKDKQVLVFVRTKQKAERLTENLKSDGFKVEAVFKAKSVSQRSAAIENFKKGELQILIATDVLSRGIDVENLPFVVNYDIPASPEDYVHRVGRTGRAGQSGTALSFVSHTPQLVKVGMKPVELHDVHFMKTVERFISEPVETRKIPGPWKDDTLQVGVNGVPLVVDNSNNQMKNVIIESKKQALRLLEQKYEKDRKMVKHAKTTGKKTAATPDVDLSETYVSLKQKLRQMSAKPTATLADAVEDERLPLSKIPSLRNFKEGRYEDVIASFERRRAEKSGALPKESRKKKFQFTKQRKHQRELVRR
jgi:superfamily II DNA/RNA helicase